MDDKGKIHANKVICRLLGLWMGFVFGWAFLAYF
jgi:hypothetical protein